MSVRSYDLKVRRAERHLVDLEKAVAAYVATHPYEVRVDDSGRRRKFRVAITRQPDDEVALILGDFVHNARSALDHLACALVPPKRRSSTSFPIFFQGVWDSPVPGENAERTKQRGRWASITKGMDAEAIALLKSAQPPDEAPDALVSHSVDALNRIWNKDKHERIAVVAATLLDVGVRVLDPDGVWRSTIGNQGPRDGLPDGTVLQVPAGVTDVKITATPAVTVRIGNPKAKEGYEIPRSMHMALAEVRMVIDALRQFDRSKLHASEEAPVR